MGVRPEKGIVLHADFPPSGFRAQYNSRISGKADRGDAITETEGRAARAGQVQGVTAGNDAAVEETTRSAMRNGIRGRLGSGETLHCAVWAGSVCSYKI
ncbi:hypothetical protein HPP92_007349 [Vanilla planifolia]|uniref:Uncharacterized protein n=1 Tax=Vanilla planifolia TaxID=51239 RepID=A0A835RK99_VANPL|nr:hypothetical protein HPP92_007349 [Vanilla planifolia]